MAKYIALGVRCGLSIKETVQSPIGLIFDLWEMYSVSHGLKKQNNNDN